MVHVYMHASIRVMVRVFSGSVYVNKEKICGKKCCRKFVFSATRNPLVTLVLDGFCIKLWCLSISIVIYKNLTFIYKRWKLTQYF